MKTSKGFSPIIAIVIVLVVGLAAGVAIYFTYRETGANTNKNTNQAVTNGNVNQNVNVNTNANVNASVNINTAVDETADWKTYTNTKYHFSIQYPSGWSATEDEKTAPFHVTISSADWRQNGSIVLLSRFPFSTSGPAGAEDDLFTRSEKKVTVGGRSATEYIWTEKSSGKAYSLAIIFDVLPTDWPNDGVESKSNYERYISFGAPDSGDLTLLRQILSTFQFTDETANWKTYENTKNGYSFKYPNKNWQVEAKNDKDMVSYTLGWCNPECHASMTFEVRDITLEKFIEEYNAQDKIGKIFKQESFTLDRVLGEKLYGSTALGLTSVYIFVTKENKNYIIYYLDTDDVLKQILSTFQFTK